MLIFVQYLPEYVFNVDKHFVILKLRMFSLKPGLNQDFVRGTLKVSFDMTGHIFSTPKFPIDLFKCHITSLRCLLFERIIYRNRIAAFKFLFKGKV